MPDQLLTIGELARRAGIAPSALRYYEELGLLPTPARISGQRRYPESAVGLVGIILLLRDVRFSLAEQKTLMSHHRSPGWSAAPRSPLALAVAFGEQLLDRRPQLGHGAMRRAPQPVVSQLGEPALREVQPRWCRRSRSRSAPSGAMIV